MASKELGAGNGSSYPGDLDTDAIVEVNTEFFNRTLARAEVPNDLAAAIVAIETELGVNPAGTLTNVVTFLQTEHETDGTHGAVTPTSITASGTVKPNADNTIDLGATTTGRWKDFYLAGNLDDDTNTVTVANLKTAYDHSQDNTQAHSDYMLNAGDTSTGDYTWGGKHHDSTGESVLGADYTITADNTWEDTGLSVTLGTAGTYLIYADVRARMEVSASGFMYTVFKLYNSTDAADVSNSFRMVAYYEDVTDSPRQNMGSIQTVITTDSDSEVIKLYALAQTGGTWATKDIKSADAFGRTNLGYIRL